MMGAVCPNGVSKEIVRRRNWSMAADLAYTCQVTHVYEITPAGSLVTSSLEKQIKSSSFSVSRVTGEIIGEVLPTVLARSTRVVNQGSKEYSFKAVADFGEHFQLLEVQEFREGAIKPFVASSMGGAGIVTGVCK
jgi:hypothetical protein